MHRVAVGVFYVLGLGSLIGCGSETSTETAGSGGTGGGDACALDPAGEAFSFIIRNTGERDLWLALGCGAYLPLELTTPDGAFGLGPENAEHCGFTCESIYGGATNTDCTDCGPGSRELLPMGETATLTWDRRIHRPHVAPAECSGHADGNACALAVAVEPTEVTDGTLEICTGEPVGGRCGTSESVDFTLDLTASELTIDVQ